MGRYKVDPSNGTVWTWEEYVDSKSPYLHHSSSQHTFFMDLFNGWPWIEVEDEQLSAFKEKMEYIYKQDNHDYTTWHPLFIKDPTRLLKLSPNPLGK